MAHRRGGFRVEVVISLYGGEACSRSVRRGAVRCEGSNGIERHAVRFESGTLAL